MTVRVGVIGVGMIGEDHIRRLTQVLAGGQITAVTDVDADRAAKVAAQFGFPAVHTTGQDVIDSGDIDAVVVASWALPTSSTYSRLSRRASLSSARSRWPRRQRRAGASSRQRVTAGRRLVQVGFMRRYDAAYRALKQATWDGSIGSPLLVHCAHRNPAVPDTVTSEMVLADSAVHEIDLTRWLLDEEVVATTVLKPKRGSRAAGDLQDPMIVVFQTESGVLVDVELNVNVGYGYDIRGEVVGEFGTAQLADCNDIVVTNLGGRTGNVPADWRQRFIRAYDTELQEWIDGIAAGDEATGPSAWDGYAATVVADSCIAAFGSGTWSSVSLHERPDFYSK